MCKVLWLLTFLVILKKVFNRMHSVYISFWLVLGIFICCDARCDQGAYEYGVNDQEKNYIVSQHNSRRLLVAKGSLVGQPRGVDLKRMQWDNNLAQAAQNIANTCIYGHVRVTDNRWQVGQNIATGYNSAFINGANWTQPIANWWDEHLKYRFGDGFSEATGHYTQMAWNDTQFLGCGYSFYPTNGQYKYQKLYVCNYGPAGNYPRAPYTPGSSGCDNLC